MFDSVPAWAVAMFAVTEENMHREKLRQTIISFCEKAYENAIVTPASIRTFEILDDMDDIKALAYKFDDIDHLTDLLEEACMMRRKILLLNGA